MNGADFYTKPQYAKIITHLLASPDISEACKKSGIPPKKMYKLLKDPEFVLEYKRAQDKLLQHTTGYLAKNLSKATNIIVDIAEKNDTPVRVRLDACKAILEFGIKYTETSNILYRINQLENECGILEL